MKNKMNQLFKDKLFLVMMVLGLLTIVAAAGAVKIRKGDNINEQNPYLEVPQTQGILAENIPQNKTGNGGSTENAETKAQAAGSSDASYSSDDKSDSADKGENSAKAAGAGNGAAQAVTLNFGGQRTLQWPVKGNVVLDYSMETTVYFPTLDQYKCNPALIIQGDISDPVSAPADARVLESGSNEEIGNYVVLGRWATSTQPYAASSKISRWQKMSMLQKELCWDMYLSLQNTIQSRAITSISS